MYCFHIVNVHITTELHAIKMINFFLCVFPLNKRSMTVNRGHIYPTEIYLQINKGSNQRCLPKYKEPSRIADHFLSLLRHTRLSWHSFHQLSHNYITDINY